MRTHSPCPIASPPSRMQLLRLQETLAIPQWLRQEYLQSLTESQELYLESLVTRARKALFVEGARIVGYAAFHDGTLVEFFLRDEEPVALEEAFAQLVSAFRITHALCKTFDVQLLGAAASIPARIVTTGLLFRRLSLSNARVDRDVVARLVTERDVETVLSIHDDFFDGQAEVADYVSDRGLYLFETHAGEPLGCGVMKRIVPSEPFVDVGMMVARPHRGHGLGTQIVAHVTRLALNAGYRPVCGCAVENIASRRSLERAGFRSIHRLVTFTYEAGDAPSIDSIDPSRAAPRTQ